jgi:hypothetical protein
MSHPTLPVIERYGYTWIHHPDGRWYGPVYPGDDEQLVFLELEGKLGHAGVRPGESRYFLRWPREAATC